MKHLKAVKGLIVALFVVTLLVAGQAHAAIDTTAIQTAVDANLADFQAVGAILVLFVLGIAVYKGIISWFKGAGKG